jgi:hypothetical protein
MRTIKSVMVCGLALLGATTLSACCTDCKDNTAHTGMLNTTCPYSGKPINAGVFSSYKGGNVGFCCEGCKGKWDSADADARAALFSKTK